MRRFGNLRGKTERWLARLAAAARVIAWQSP
jgi:hypothetical protein